MSYQLTNGRFQAFDDDGEPLIGGLLYTYVSGTTTPKLSYLDAGLLTPNTNPVVLNARGEANVYLTSSPYSLALKTSAGVTIWTSDGVTDPASVVSSALTSFVNTLAGPAGATNVSYLQTGAGASVMTLLSKMIRQVDAEEFSVVCDWDSGAGTGTDNSVMLQRFLNRAAGTGRARLPAPVAGRYAGFSQTLIIPDGVILEGYGTNAAGTTGTVLYYTGSGDAVVITDPINSFTPTNAVISDVLIYCKNVVPGKAALSIVGASYVELNRVNLGTSGWGLILDQAELVRMRGGSINVPAGAQGGAWLVDGADHTPGANAGYTNSIGFEGVNFGGATAATAALGCAIDGAINVSFDPQCQFTGLLTQIRVANCKSLVIEGGEREGFITSSIYFANTQLDGTTVPATMSASINGGFMVGGSPGSFHIDGDAGGVTRVMVTNAIHQVLAGGAKPLNIFNVPVVSASGNASKDNNTGTPLSYANFSGLGFATNDYVAYNTQNLTSESGTIIPFTLTFAASGGGFALGNGTLTTTVARNGPLVTYSFRLTFGSTTTPGTGQYTITVPFTELYANGTAWVGSLLVARGSTIYPGCVRLGSSGTTLTMYTANAAVGATAPITFTTADVIEGSITYGTRSR